MFSCYRKDDAHDPELYCAAIAATLGDYARGIVEFATDPRTGIASKSRFLPSVSEVREFCDAELVRRDRLARFDGMKPVPRKEIPVRDGEITYDEFLKRAAAMNLPPRPIGNFELNGAVHGARESQSESEKQATLDDIAAANRRFFEGECRACGLAPSEQVASPSLLRSLIGNQV